MAAHDGAKPVPAWVYVVYAAGKGDAADLEGLTEEQSYDLVSPMLPGGMKVGVQQQHMSWLLKLVGQCRVMLVGNEVTAVLTWVVDISRYGICVTTIVFPVVMGM